MLLICGALVNGPYALITTAVSADLVSPFLFCMQHIICYSVFVVLFLISTYKNSEILEEEENILCISDIQEQYYTYISSVLHQIMWERFTIYIRWRLSLSFFSVFNYFYLNILFLKGTHKSLHGNAKALSTVTAIIDGTGSVGMISSSRTKGWKVW